MALFWVRPGIRRSFRLAVFRRARREADLSDELRLHVELRTAQLVARGLEPEAARAEALRRLGDSTFEGAFWRLLPYRTRAERRMRVRDWLDAIRQDVGFSLRQLRRNPGFTVAVIATLAVAVGATATMFGIVDRLMIRPPAHVEAPGSVYRLFMTLARSEQDETSVERTPFDFWQTIRDRVTSVRVAGSHASELAVGREESASRERVRFVSPGYFELLGTRPRLGRFFTGEEAEHTSGARVAVLGHGAWLRRFGGEQSALGRTIDIEGIAHTVIGVAPEGFHGVTVEPVEVWAPLATLHALPSEQFLFSYGNPLLELLLRRPASISDAQASSELTLALQESEMMTMINRPGRPTTDVRVDLVPLGGAIDASGKRTSEATVAIWLAGVSIILLLVACANVASLFMLRAEQRARELAVRLALGVGRARLAIQLFVESATVVALGGVAAVIVTATGGAWLRRVLLPDVAWEGWAADRRILLLTIAALLATALLTGLAPAAYGWRSKHQGVLAGAARGTGGAARRGWLQRPLLLAQTALSVVLLVGAGLFLKSLHELRAVDLGIEPSRVLRVQAEFTNVGWKTAEINAFAERAAARLRAVPGVEAVAKTNGAPFMSMSGGSVRIPGRDSLVKSLGSAPSKMTISPEFFDVLGMRLLRGRGIQDVDRVGTPLVAVINETMEKRFWPDRSAIGECFYAGNVPECFTVVGIVRDAHRFRFKEEAWPHYYLALAQETFQKSPDMLLVRTAGDADRHVARVQEALRGAAPELPMLEVVTLQSILDPQERPWQLGATVFTVYGAFAVLLSALGLYSAIAYGVVMRTRELGVRIAIGARARQILTLILGEGVRIGAIGLAIGLLLTLLAADRLGERLTSLLFEVAPRDGIVIAGVALVLTVAILLASVVPAWRATRVDPLIAMRAE